MNRKLIISLMSIPILFVILYFMEWSDPNFTTFLYVSSQKFWMFITGQPNTAVDALTIGPMTFAMFWALFMIPVSLIMLRRR